MEIKLPGGWRISMRRADCLCVSDTRHYATCPRWPGKPIRPPSGSATEAPCTTCGPGWNQAVARHETKGHQPDVCPQEALDGRRREIEDALKLPSGSATGVPCTCPPDWDAHVARMGGEWFHYPGSSKNRSIPACPLSPKAKV